MSATKKKQQATEVNQFKHESTSIVREVRMWFLKKPISFTLSVQGKGRLSLHTSQVAHQAGAYPGFCSMKRLGVFLLPPGWDANLSLGYPQH